MAVTECKFKRSMSGGFDRRNRGTYNVEYDVYADTKMGVVGIANGALTASPHALPNLGDDYDYESILGTGEKDAYSYALNYGVDFLDEDRKRAVITVNFTPLEPGETQEQRSNPDPLTRGARISGDNEVVMRIADRNSNGTPIVNGAGKPFDRPLQIEAPQTLMVAQFNVPELATAVTLPQIYESSVNETAWTFITPNPAPRTVLCKSARPGELTTEGEHSFYPIQFAFAFKRNGETWDKKILNEGYSHCVMAPGQTYGFAYAASDFDTEDGSISLTGGSLVENNHSETAPTSVDQPTPAISGKGGDQLYIVYSGGEWGIGEPNPKLRPSGLPYTQDAVELNEDGTPKSPERKLSETVLLYANGCRLPDKMIGNFVTATPRYEADFNALNSYLVAS